MRTIVMTCMLISLAAVRAADADGPRAAGETFSLREVLLTAVRQNPELAGFSMDVTIARAGIVEATGSFDTTLDARVTAGTSRKDPTPGAIYEQLEKDGVAVSVGGTSRLRAGGSVSLRLEAGTNRTMNRLSQAGRDLDEHSRLYQPTLRLSAVQPLLKGMGWAARAPLERARVATDVAMLAREVAAATVLRDVVIAYWELVFAHRELEIRRSSLQLAREQLRIVKLGIELGKHPPDAFAEVEVEVGLREEDVLIAENGVAERSLDLRRLAGLEVGPGRILVDPSDQPADVHPERDLEEAVELALAQSPALQEVRGRRRSAALELRAREDATRPQLDLQLDVAAAGSDREPTDAVGRMAGFGGLDAKVGLLLTVPLAGDGARGARDVARGQVLKARMTEADVSAQVTLAVVRAVNEVRLARKRALVLATSAELGRVNLSHENQRYELGASTSFEVLKRQRELAEIQLRQARASIDHLVALARLEALTGELIGSWGIATAGESRR